MKAWQDEAKAAKSSNAKSKIIPGGLAQLARAPALHAGGQRFESVILHQSTLDKEQSSKLKVQRVESKD